MNQRKIQRFSKSLCGGNSILTRGPRIAISVLLLLMVIGLPVMTAGCGHDAKPLKIGVLLDLTGSDAMDFPEVLDWMTEQVNGAGGIGGHPVELVYRDTSGGDIVTPATELAENKDIRVVIGPQRSTELLEIAQLFIDHKKLLISPTATAGSIMRAFTGSDYIWRTCQSDVAQVRSILFELASRDVNSVALVYPQDSYGSTFYEWTGFFCVETGIELKTITGYLPDENLEAVMDAALAGEPDYILTAAFSREAAAFKQIIDSRDTDTKLFFTEAAETPYMIETLGAAAEGIELISPAADPRSGFEEAYYQEFGYYPWDFAATTADAFLLSVYTLARQEYKPRESLEESFRAVVTGTGEPLMWNRSGEAVNQLLKGDLPDVNGASGPMAFDTLNGVDPTESYYSLNRVETWNGETDFRTIARFSSTRTEGIGLLDEATSAVLTRASDRHAALVEAGAVYQPGLRHDLWAVIAVTSSGWDNYRHQADALAVYTMLKENGVSDDHIIIITADDVPWIPENPIQGDIHHEPRGDNLRAEAVIDYDGEAVTIETLRHVLLNGDSPAGQPTLGSDKESNLFIYLVGHGLPGAIPFHEGGRLESSDFAALIDEMYQGKLFRQAFIMVETCFGESMALEIETPGVLFFTGASRMEPSFGARYDRDIKQWLADDFTAQALSSMVIPGMTLQQLYLETYGQVTGSHVRLANYERFGDLNVPVTEFITP